MLVLVYVFFDTIYVWRELLNLHSVKDVLRYMGKVSAWFVLQMLILTGRGALVAKRIGHVVGV